MILRGRNFSFDLTDKTLIMGILNVTPDSFSDGGRFFDSVSAVRQAVQMVRDGADLIDIGGQSTRPGADPVTVEEEVRRTVPVIRTLAKEITTPISIDTFQHEVAKQALDAGAAMVNDVSGLRFDPGMAGIVAEYEAAVVIMHMKGTPKDMQESPEYEALIPEILDFLREGIRRAADAGIPGDRIVIDPGIGFGKRFEHNLEIIHHLSSFSLLEKPLLVGPSRKAFIGKILEDAPPAGRLEGTAAAVAVSIFNGADIIRVHDVKEMAKVAAVADAIKRKRIQRAE